MKLALDLDKFNKKELIIFLISLALFYGIILINYVALTIFGSVTPGYHLWLVLMYFAPFVSVVAFQGIRNWELLLGLGMLTSLMNDLFWMPVYIFAFNWSTWVIPIPLIDWITWQLGFSNSGTTWLFNAGFFTADVTSQIMGVAIWIRLILTGILVWKWWVTE